MHQFGKISSIDPEVTEAWESRLFLTFDIDWASDEVVHDTIDLVELAGVEATWFITHESNTLERLRANKKFELGIHPNFNFLLQCDSRNGASIEEVVDRLLAVVPEARSVRSHSVAQSTGIIDLFARKGLTHDVNDFVPEHSGIELKPWNHWTKITKVPYFWEDDVHCLMTNNARPAELFSRPGLKVFDFHPIHVMLNTECLTRYQGAREDFKNFTKLRERRNVESSGSRSLLMELLGL
jgi:hypothetical protein